MRSPDAVLIILLATLFAFAISDSNGISLDPRNLWTLLKLATANGNQYVSAWFQSTFCTPNGQINMNDIPSNDMSVESGDTTEQSIKF
ncbi:hypothetical protein KPH14_011699 [Odynerus spinipes]|uniref:Uncharacterized protein n=1 Tax=Odynerus spinipes TaxID=1348599 RepID=A0AAD9VUL9_9HYME|nr:hypothetical protein KPH14_011699 [Odynerus spinipes]